MTPSVLPAVTGVPAPPSARPARGGAAASAAESGSGVDGLPAGGSFPGLLDQAVGAGETAEQIPVDAPVPTPGPGPDSDAADGHPLPEAAIARGLLDRASLPSGAPREPGQRDEHNPHVAVAAPVIEPVAATPDEAPVPADSTGATDPSPPTDGLEATDPAGPDVDATPAPDAATAEPDLPAPATGNGPDDLGVDADHVPVDQPVDAPGTEPAHARGLLDRASLPSGAPREPGHRAEHNPHLAVATPEPSTDPRVAVTPAPSADPGTITTSEPSSDLPAPTPSTGTPTVPMTAAPAPSAVVAPSASPAPAAPVVPAEVAAQLHAHVRTIHGPSGVRAHETTLVLNPEHLGEVRVRVQVEDGVVSLQLGGGAPATQDALRDALPDLRRMVEESGLRLGSADLADLGDRASWSGSTRDDQGGGRPRIPRPDWSPEPERTADTTAFRPPRTGSGRGLDLIA